jgi:glycosyltransferase involved in cell wall biosynthesis
MNVLALTFGDPDVASVKFRLGQYVEPLRQVGIYLTMEPAKKFRKWSSLPGYDLVIVQKRLMPVRWVKRIHKDARHLIFDTDDAIWEPHGRKHSWWTRLRTNRRLAAIVSLSDACTVPNEHLANYLRPQASHVEIIPMALDEHIWKPPVARTQGQVRIGWSGAPPNLDYLTNLSHSLNEIQTLRPEVEVVVYCGRPPIWQAPVRSIHIPFSPGTEHAAVQTFDIGLLPLPFEAFTAGKSPIKALQYAACGIPCIASPVGATLEIVKSGETGLTATTQAEWTAAILRLVDDTYYRHELGARAYSMHTSHHTRTSCQARMLDFWRNLQAV